jgi:hypothetical protein
MVSSPLASCGSSRWVKPLAGVISLIVGGLILLLSCLPDPEVVKWGNHLFDAMGWGNPDIRQWIFNSPKLGHVFFYGGLAFALMQVFPSKRIVAVLITLVFGAVLEFLQQYVPTRSVNASDLLYNVAGICVALLVFEGTRHLPKLKANETSHLS